MTDETFVLPAMQSLQDVIDWAERDAWQGQVRPWMVHEPCPARLRGRVPQDVLERLEESS